MVSFGSPPERLAVVQKTPVHASGFGIAHLHQIFKLPDAAGILPGLIARHHRFEQETTDEFIRVRRGRFSFPLHSIAGFAWIRVALIRNRFQLRPALIAELIRFGELDVTVRTTFHGRFLLKKVRFINNTPYYTPVPC